MKRWLWVSCIFAAGCGGSSLSTVKPASVPVLRKTTVLATAVAYDVHRDLVYVSSGTSSDVLIVNPASGLVVGQVAVSATPQELAISGDDTKLYVGLGTSIQRIDLGTRTVDQTFWVDPALASLPSAPIDGSHLRVQPGNPDTIAFLYWSMAGTMEPVMAIHVLNNGTLQEGFGAVVGIPLLEDLQFSTDGTSVAVEYETGMSSYSVAQGGFAGQFAQTAHPSFFPTAEARGKLYVGPTAYDDKSGKSLGTFTVSSPTWVFVPETTADRAVAFSCGAKGANTSLQLLDTAKFTTISSAPLTGFPAVDGAGVNQLIIAGSRCALILMNPSTNKQSLAFIDNVTF